MRHLTRIGVLAGLALLSVGALAGAASGQEAATLPPVPVGQRIPEVGHQEPGFRRGHTAPGTVTEIATIDAPAVLDGGTCDVEVVGANNESVHPGSDILVASANTVTIADVERASGAETFPADGTLQISGSVTVSVRLGSDGLFSGGALVVQFDCTPPPPPPTTAPPPTAPPAAPPTTPTTVIGPPLPPQTKPCDNPEAPQTETTADDCALPKTGSTSAPLALIGGGILAAGALALGVRPGRA